jgi:hypothetical protein
LPNPAGWGRNTSAKLDKVLKDSNAYIQKLNDEYTNPSGKNPIVPAEDEFALEGSAQPGFSRAESAGVLNRDN